MMACAGALGRMGKNQFPYSETFERKLYERIVAMIFFLGARKIGGNYRLVDQFNGLCLDLSANSFGYNVVGYRRY